MVTARREGTHLHTHLHTQADTHSHLEAYEHEVDIVARECMATNSVKKDVFYIFPNLDCTMSEALVPCKKANTIFLTSANMLLDFCPAAELSTLFLSSGNHK